MNTPWWVRFGAALAIALIVVAADSVRAQDWAYWRGPANDGMTSGSALLVWDDETHVKWKVPISGRGFSSPVVWGDQIFVTTAVKIDADGAIVPEPRESRPGFRGGNGGGWGPGNWQGQDGGRGGDDGDWQRRREEWLRQRGGSDADRQRGREERRHRRETADRQGRHGDGEGQGGGWWGRRNAEPQVAHRFLLLSIDKDHWRRDVGACCDGGHAARRILPLYGSFASNSPVTDGEHVFAYFGSRGVYCYDLEGNLMWSKDLVR